MKMDLGVRLLYLIYGHAIRPRDVKSIQHELIKASPLFYHLEKKGESISKIMDALSQGDTYDKSRPSI